MAHGLPQLQRTPPPRGRHPFVYLAAFFLLLSFVTFIARIGMFFRLTGA